MSELNCLIGRFSTNIGDKLGSKVADLAKYVHLQEVGRFVPDSGRVKMLTAMVNMP